MHNRHLMCIIVCVETHRLTYTEKGGVYFHKYVFKAL